MGQGIFRVSIIDVNLLSFTIAVVFCGSLGVEIHLASFPEMMSYSLAILLYPKHFLLLKRVCMVSSRKK